MKATEMDRRTFIASSLATTAILATGINAKAQPTTSNPLVLTTQSPTAEFFDQLFQKHQGIALGEDHKSSEIFQFVATNADLFKSMGVKTLYLEAILSEDTENVQDALKMGDQKFLSNYFYQRSWSEQLAGDYNNMVQEIYKAGIEIVGIDKRTGSERSKEANSHWVSEISKHNGQLVQNEKFLVLGGLLILVTPLVQE